MHRDIDRYSCACLKSIFADANETARSGEVAGCFECEISCQVCFQGGKDRFTVARLTSIATLHALNPPHLCTCGVRKASKGGADVPQI